MAVISGQIIIGVTRVAIDGVSTNPYRLRIHNMSNTQNIFLGGGDVTVSNGLELHSHESFEIIVSPNEQIFAVASSGNHEVSWLRMDV
jgi:hypothetical protein